MHGITTLRAEEIIFFALVWLVAFAAAFSRTVRDGEYRGIGNACAIGFAAGLFSFGIVAFLVDRDPGHADRYWYYLGVSTLIGLLAKEQDKFGRIFLNNAFLAAKLFFQKSNNDTDKKE